MINQRNYGIAEGRLVRDPVFRDNKDGSKKVLFTVAARQNYKGKDGDVGSDFIQLQAFIPAGKTDSVYEKLQTGDLIGAEYTVKSSAYTDDNGGEHYTQALQVNGIDLKETKATAEARRARSAAKGDDVPFENQPE